MCDSGKHKMGKTGEEKPLTKKRLNETKSRGSKWIIPQKWK